ncbi:MAG: hypothetical protein IIB00_03535, partial [candidate division Zixibacteria bacterium]|nr:hypothetical protein [candidate division Zixibacteria bacterium]
MKSHNAEMMPAMAMRGAPFFRRSLGHSEGGQPADGTFTGCVRVLPVKTGVWEGFLVTTRKLPQNSAKLIVLLLLSIGFLAPVSLAIDRDAEVLVWRELVNTRRYINPREIGMAAGVGSAQALSSDAILAEGQLPPSVATGVGLQIGLTYYDIQQTGSMNRQIATRGTDHCIYFGWNGQDNNSAVAGLCVSANTYDAALGSLSEASGFGIYIGCGLVPPHRAFSLTQDAFEDGRAVLAHHNDPAYSFPGKFYPFAFHNDIPCLVDFAEMVSGGLVPESLWGDSLSIGGTYFAWPRVAATHDATCGKVVHLVIHDDGNSGYYMYVRRTVTTSQGTQFSDSNWIDGYRFGLGGFLSPAITASRQSQKVGIAWSGGRGDGSEFGASLDRYNGLISGQNDNDLFYMESQDCGA